LNSDGIVNEQDLDIVAKSYETSPLSDSRAD
jgi:hypothetical protein